MSTTVTTAPVTRTVTVNGKPLSFLVGTVKSGDRKGQQVLVPAFKNAAKPDLADVMEWTAPLGQSVLAKQYAKVIRGIVTDACQECNVKVKDAEGHETYVVDDGKLVNEINERVAELDAGTAEVIKTELEELNRQMSEIVQKVFGEYIGKKLAVPEELTNRALNLTTKQAALQLKLQKRSKKPAAAVAPTVPAPAKS